jgi:hypothetical protein
MLAVMGITVLGDGIGKAKEELTDKIRRLHVLRIGGHTSAVDERYRDVASISRGLCTRAPILLRLSLNRRATGKAARTSETAELTQPHSSPSRIRLRELVVAT